MINLGDKFVVEIEKVFEQDGEKLYRAKGFKSLVFDDNGLKKLVPLEEIDKEEMEAVRNAGREEVWELIKFIKKTDKLEVRKIFDVPVIAHSAVTWILKQDVNDVLDKYHEWKRSEHEIKVGDVVKHKNGRIGVVTYKNDLILRGILEDSTTFDWFIADCSKTGKHIEIESVIQQIKEG